jgi:hypothetical protein
MLYTAVIIIMDLFLEVVLLIYKFILTLKNLKVLLILDKLIQTVTINMEILSRNKDFLVEKYSPW